MNKKKTIGFMLLIMCAFVLVALDPTKSINQYMFDTWNNKNGLPQSYVMAITQTKSGYIWIGTQEGVVRFDGVRMETYNTNNVAEFKSNMITCFSEGKDETLWIGTLNGLMRYKNGKFKLFTENDGLTYNMVRALGVDVRGDLWIGTEKGLCKYSNKKFIKYEIGVNNHNNYINSIIMNRNNKFFIATKYDIYQLKSEKFISLGMTDELQNEISVLYSDSLNNLWIGTVNRGLFKYSNDNLVPFTGKGKISGTYISSIVEDTNNCLWVGTQNGGLNRIYKNKISNFTEKEGLRSNFILKIFEDRDNNIWVGSAISGLSRLRNGKVTVYGAVEGIISKSARTIFEDSHKNLWVGAANGGLYKKQDDKFITIGDGIIKGNEIRTIMGDSEGNIWIGTIGAGLYIVNINGGILEPFLPALQLPSNNVFAIYKSSRNIMWVGTAAGISKYENKKFTNYTSAHMKKLNTVRAITEDKFGTIWLTVEGMGVAKLDEGEFSFIDKKDGLESNIITYIYFDDENIGWIATYGGGISWLRKNKLTSLTAKNGLFRNNIYTIIEDNGKLWMSCNDGIFSVDKKELIKFEKKKINKITCTSFNESSGMKNRECNGGNYPVAWKDNKGALWFPNVQGVVKVEPKKIKLGNGFPNLVIEKILVDEKEKKIKKINVVSAGYRRITFQYTALAFKNPKSIRFRVRLKGVEKEWVDMNTVRKTYYTLIPPGEYTFELISTNGEGKWSNKPVSIRINLKPFFYQTLVFKILLIILLLITIFIFIKMRLKALNRKKNDLESEVKKRTIEIRQKNEELEKLSIVARETDNGVIITEVNGNVLWVNDGFVRMYGYTFEEFKKTTGGNIREFSARDDFGKIIDKCIREEKTIRYETKNNTRLGKTIWIQTSLTPVFDDKANIKEFIFVETDITKLKAAYNKMKEMSLTDQLTKLKNRRYFHNLIDRDIQIAKRKLYKKNKNGLVYSMIFLMVDIDFFKKVNDTYGHNAGDQLLIQISNRMKQTLRTSDLLVRWGGEEFLIMAKDDNFEGARLLSLRLLKAIESELFDLNGVEVNITISIGYCGFPILSKNPNQFGWKDIVEMADSALYKAKDGGRKRSVGVQFKDEILSDKDCNLLTQDFDKALEKGIIEIITSTTDL